MPPRNPLGQGLHRGIGRFADHQGLDFARLGIRRSAEEIGESVWSVEKRRQGSDPEVGVRRHGIGTEEIDRDAAKPGKPSVR